MTYNEAVEKINSLLVFGSKPGLERVSELVKRIGSPDKKLKFVHIAGTNGKGSTTELIANTLTKAGYKTGMFISPFVLDFRERFQIDGKMIDENELATIVEQIYPVVMQMKDEGKIITEFEFVFAIALVWYSSQKCDCVVLETGLGGRFDATNIIDTPLVSVITSISLDHTAILGDTYEKIAFEKCGIIKSNGYTVAYGEQKDGVLDVIRNSAKEKNNKLYVADVNSITKKSSSLDGSEFSFSCEMFGISDLKIRFIGEHQLKNSATALYTIGVLRQRGFNIPDSAIKDGFKTAFFPARLELLGKNPIVLLDGAHNPGGAEALSRAIKDNLSGKKKTGIVGMLADKDVHTALSMLLPLFDEIITVSPHSPRAMTSEMLAQTAKEYCKNITIMNDYDEAFRKALSCADSDSAIVIFGSLFLAGDMRKVILKNLKP